MTDGTTRREFFGRDPLKENPSTLVTIPIERTVADGR